MQGGTLGNRYDCTEMEYVNDANELGQARSEEEDEGEPEGNGFVEEEAEEVEHV